ncbi:MAG: DUF2341 domain-containing protein, partial [Candidatus Caenarcaniphilales bacterium]|nr:DUF2341 domain-containing protein [Candidatus Caenarcaniphilales bacterium]
ILTEYNNQNNVSTFATIGSPTGPENLADWAFRIPLTINKSQVNGSVTDFPVYIDLNSFPNSFFTNAKNDGSDIRITTSDGATRVPVELVSYSAPTTNGELWFRAPSLSSSTNGTFYVYYGNSNAIATAPNSTYGSQNVWSNGFVAVYHMNALTNGTASVLDSTSSAYHGTPFGNMSTIASSKMGNSIVFDGSNDYINFGTASLANLTTQMYVSSWVYPVSYGNYGGIITRQKNTPFDGGWGLAQNQSDSNKFSSINFNLTSFEYIQVSSNPATSTWNYLSSRNLSGTRTIFLNSVSQATSAVIATASPAQMVAGRFYFDTNNFYFNGRIDEIRVVNKSRNNNWITTEYNNQNAVNSFVTVGANGANLSAWNYRAKLTMRGILVNGTVSQLPVTVDLSHLPEAFFGNVKASGADIRITAADLVSQMPVEVVSINKVSRTGEIWFRTDSLAENINKDYFIWCGNNGATLPAASSTFGSQNVWSNGFVAVYHMNALSNGTASVLDSTSFANHGTPYGGMTAGADLVAGRTGSAIDFDGSNDMIDINNDAELQIGTGTISSWIKTADAGSGFRGIVTKQNAYSSFLSTNVLILYDWGGGGTRSSSQNLANNTWRHNAISFQSSIGSGTNFYTDGVLRATSSMTVNNQTVKLAIGAGSGAPGNQFFAGNIDEARVANKVRHRNWITTEYNNQYHPAGFYLVNNGAVGAYNGATAYPLSHKITVQSSRVNGTVTDLPVYVNLAHLPDAFFNSVQSDGKDIRILAADQSTELPYELLSLNTTTNQGELWFRAPTLSSAADTNFYIRYGRASAMKYLETHPYGTQQVWSNGFVAVWHMNALTNGTASVLDSTRFANHATPYGNMTNGVNLLSGKLGQGVFFDGINDYMHELLNPTISGSQFTVSSWIRPELTNSRTYFSLGNASGSVNKHMVLRPSANTTLDISFWGNDLWATTPDVLNTWTHVHNTMDASGNRRIYSNGVLRNSDGPVLFWNGDNNLRIGSRVNSAFFNGKEDEVRVANKSRNRNWVLTEYNNQSNPSIFYTVDNGAVPFNENDWLYSHKITVRPSQVNGSVTEFPVYIDLSHLPDLFFTNVKADGGDIRVTRVDRASQLPVELVSINTAAKTGELWFRAHQLVSTSNNDFYLFYGNSLATTPAASSTFGSQNVWSNGFVAVYHMNAVTNGTASVLDSTSFARHGTPSGNMSTTTGGRMGTSITFDGANDNVDIGSSISNIF